MIGFGFGGAAPAGAAPAQGGGGETPAVESIFTDDKIYAPGPMAAGDENGSYWQDEMLFAYNVFRSTSSFTPADALFSQTLIVGPGAGGGWCSDPAGYEASGGSGGYVGIHEFDFPASVSQSIAIAGGGAGSTSLSNQGSNAPNMNVFGNALPIAGGGRSLNHPVYALSGAGNTSGFVYSDKTGAVYPIFGVGHAGGKSDTPGADPECRLAGGSAGAGGPGGDSNKATRTAGAAGLGLDVSAEFPFLSRPIFGCGAPGTARAMDAGAVFHGAAAEWGCAPLEQGEANSGNGGGPGGSNSLNKGNGGSGLVVLKYRIA